MRYFGYRKTGAFIYKELLPPGVLAHSMTHEHKLEVEKKVFKSLDGISSFKFNEYLNEIVDVQPKALGVFLREITDKYFFSLAESKLKGFVNHMIIKNDRTADFVFLRILFKNFSNINTHVILSYVAHVIKIHKQYIDAELMNEIIAKIQYITPSKYNVGYLAIIASHGKREDIISKIKKFLFENNSIETEYSLVSIFNLNKQGHMTFEDKCKYFDTLKLEDVCKIDSFNRISEIYLNDEHYYPKFNEFIMKNIDFIASNSNNRVILNILNNLCLKPVQHRPNIHLTIYNELLKRKEMTKPMDVATLVHNMRKLSLDVRPFLELITEDIITKSSPTEIAILFHSCYRYLPQKKILLLKNRIINELEQMSPKLILNIAKDLVDDKENYSKEFTDKFEQRASNFFCLHTEPESIEFKTQLISFYYSKFKIENSFDSDDEFRLV